jgi:hypothetical protein
LSGAATLRGYEPFMVLKKTSQMKALKNKYRRESLEIDFSCNVNLANKNIKGPLE